MLAASMSDDDCRTLYLRNVPDEVVERLAHMARRERLSLNAYVVRQLTAVASGAG
jgi:predicted HicB family RNase H-like nuclease